MPSGAGLNRAGLLGGIQLLKIGTGATAVTAPLTAYGTIGANDSGGLMHAAAGFTKWTFQLVGPGSQGAGYMVTIYGTTGPDLLNFVYKSGPTSGLPMDTCAVTAVPAYAWFALPAPSDQSGTGSSVGNPLISGSATVLNVNMALYGVRAVLTTIASPTNFVSVICSAVP